MAVLRAEKIAKSFGGQKIIEGISLELEDVIKVRVLY